MRHAKFFLLCCSNLISYFSITIFALIGFCSKHRTSKKYIIGYLPKTWKEGILEFLFNDIARSSKSENTEYLLTANIFTIKTILHFNPDSLVLSLHQNLLQSLLHHGVPCQSICCFYTHSRLTTSLGSILKMNIKMWLPMNFTEANALLLSGVNPSHILRFPAGIDLTLFGNSSEALPTRCYDIVVSLKYPELMHGHYYDRKNYNILVPLINLLASAGLKVAIVGKGWSKSNLHQSVNIFFFDLPHFSTSNVYLQSKIYISLALQEGGPISFLEASACGCLCLCSPTGFALDFGHSADLGYYLLPSNASCKRIYEMINQLIVLSNDNMHEQLILKRKVDLESYSFSFHSLTLENL